MQENITISNIIAFNAGMYGSSITGIPDHPVKNVLLENIRIFYSGGGSEEDAVREVDEKIKSYPEATMFGNLPSYGMFIRHAENITMSNIQFHLASIDNRPAFYLEDIKKFWLRDAMADLSEKNPLMKARNVHDILIQNPSTPEKASSVINILGEEISSIRLSGIDSSKFKEIYTAPASIQPKEVKIISQFE